MGEQLENKLSEYLASEFPTGANYYARYQAAKDYLSTNVYTEIQAAVLVKEAVAGNIPIYLNDHGLNHVNMVIRRASEMLSFASEPLSPYEIYILLMAILFHDAGNIFGREGHTKACKVIMDHLGVGIFPDNTERRIIYKIAAAHGGVTDHGDKDTVKNIQREMHLFDQKVRKGLLAAVLRLADELADESTRSSRYAQETGIVPPSSEVFHAYSQALKACHISERDITLSFEVVRKDVSRQLGKMDGEIFLIDEIFSRTHKVFTECIYCMRYCRSLLHIGKIKVSIRIYDDELYEEIIPTITYELEERGYPSEQPDIFSICPELKEVTGEMLSKKIEAPRS